MGITEILQEEAEKQRREDAVLDAALALSADSRRRVITRLIGAIETAAKPIEPIQNAPPPNLLPRGISNAVSRALSADANGMATVDSEVRKRRKWAYVRGDTLAEWTEKKRLTGTPEELAVQFFEREIGTPVRVNQMAADHDKPGSAYMYAVWNSIGEPDIEPQF